MTRLRLRRVLGSMAAAVLAASAATTVGAWGTQGHRLIALVAADRLSPVARQNVAWLLDGQSLADVANWADRYRDDATQTGRWHYVDIPLSAAAYDRDRDCPMQPDADKGSRADKWRDCAVDRILDNEERLGSVSLDRADRALALKFVVHLVGDLHQPMHGIDEARGGNDIHVIQFGSATCGRDFQTNQPRPCNLHGTWDSALIAHRQLDDQQYLQLLSRKITQNHWDATAEGAPADWALESHDLAKAAMLPEQGAVDEAYYKVQIEVVERRLAVGGIRLAAVLNRILAVPPPLPPAATR
jgi:hypothetical protein